MSPFERRCRDVQIDIITNFVVLSSVGIKRVDCSMVEYSVVAVIFYKGDTPSPFWKGVYSEKEHSFLLE